MEITLVGCNELNQAFQEATRIVCSPSALNASKMHSAAQFSPSIALWQFCQFYVGQNGFAGYGCWLLNMKLKKQKGRGVMLINNW